MLLLMLQVATSVLEYSKFYGRLNLAVTIGCYLVFLGTQSFAAIWLSQWANDAALPDGKQDLPLRDERLGVYGGAGAVLGKFCFITIALGHHLLLAGGAW